MNREEYVSEIVNTLGLCESSGRTYEIVLRKYTELNNMSLEELLQEAEEEEEEQVRLKHRTLKKRLMTFREDILKNYRTTTARTYLAVLKAFYNFHEIEIPKIPPIRITKVEGLQDIPTFKEVRQAVNSTGSYKLKAIILFMSSSGCGRTECCNLTVHDFMKATEEYHNEVTVGDFIKKIKHTENVVPTFHIVRQKTKTPYYTFCTPEATQAIAQYLWDTHFKKEVLPTDKLFGLTPRGVIDSFQRINEANHWDFVDSHRFFHSHALRKLFATTLTRAQVDPTTIHFLMGHNVDAVTSAYLKVDPEVQKIKYMKIMHYFGVNDVSHYNEITASEKNELQDLRQLTIEYDNRIKEIERLLNER